MTRRLSTIALAVAVLAGLAAAPAQADFHLMKIREVFAGSSASPGAAYVELQMYSSGQSVVAGHSVRVYDDKGKEVVGVPFPANVARGENQSTLLVATPQLGIAADATLPNDVIKAAGGAVCFDDIDCVSWGNFTGALPAGTPAGAIPDGLALQRTIGRGCATALDGADDSDNSAADFVAVTPAPRPNSVAPTEQLCSGSAGSGGGGGGGDGGAPQTTLRGKPAKRTTDRTPTFRFAADEKGAKFECKLDGKRYRSCRSPYTTKALALGPHTFRVRAVANGRTDASPASFRFRVVAKRG